MIDLYQKGIDLYGQLANRQTGNNNQQSSNVNTTVSTATLTNDETSLGKQGSLQSYSNVANGASNNKHFEMHKLLQDKFNELENSFRNLLLVDGVSSY